MKHYLIVDAGTGNLRVSLADSAGKILKIETTDMIYCQEPSNPDAVSFLPEQMWIMLTKLIERLLCGFSQPIDAISVTSARHNLILLDENMEAFVGYPNIDYRAMDYSRRMTQSDMTDKISGRSPSSIFAAVKLAALRQEQPEVFERTRCIADIADWLLFKFSGNLSFEYTQACETLLFDPCRLQWSTELLDHFQLSPALLPAAVPSGTCLGCVAPQLYSLVHGTKETLCFAGGADTQMAARGISAKPGDTVIVSGTTTPIVHISDKYPETLISPAWYNPHTIAGEFSIEMNAGITGLNYQRFKALFFEKDSYECLEAAIDMEQQPKCVAALGTSSLQHKEPLIKGGFFVEAPISHTLSRYDFLYGVLADITFSIYMYYEHLERSFPCTGRLLGCGGGFQSKVIPQLLCGLIGRPIFLPANYRQASVSGCIDTINTSLGIPYTPSQQVVCYSPSGCREEFVQTYHFWKDLREKINKV